MSLTSFLKIPDVKEEFARRFPKPEFSLKKEILAPPITERPSLVGTAFDYLLRFYLKRLNPEAVTTRWVAEIALASPSLDHAVSEANGQIVIDGNTGEITIHDRYTGELIPNTETGIFGIAKQIVDEAKLIYNSYLSSGEMTDEVIKSALRLAEVDPIFRAGYIDDNLGVVYKEDIADLRNLISIVDPEKFRARKLCMLNPTFGEASRLVGGADADLLIDGTLVDIKTTKTLRLIRDYFDQLVGYYILFKIGGLGDVPYLPSIERVGIYYSRYAELYTVPVSDIVDDRELPSFIDWFQERAAREFSHPKFH